MTFKNEQEKPFRECSGYERNQIVLALYEGQLDCLLDDTWCKLNQRSHLEQDMVYRVREMTDE